MREVRLGGPATLRGGLALSVDHREQVRPRGMERDGESAVKSVRALGSATEADAPAPLDRLGVLESAHRAPGEGRAPGLVGRPGDLGERRVIHPLDARHDEGDTERLLA